MNHNEASALQQALHDCESWLDRFPGHRYRTRVLSMVGRSYLDLLDKTHNPENFEKGLEYVREALNIEITKQANFSRIVRARELSHLARVHQRIWRELRDDEAIAAATLTESVQLFEHAVELLRIVDSEWLSQLSQLADAYKVEADSRLDRHGHETALGHFQRFLDRVSEAYEARPFLLIDLSLTRQLKGPDSGNGDESKLSTEHYIEGMKTAYKNQQYKSRATCCMDRPARELSLHAQDAVVCELEKEPGYRVDDPPEAWYPDVSHVNLAAEAVLQEEPARYAADLSRDMGDLRDALATSASGDNEPSVLIEQVQRHYNRLFNVSEDGERIENRVSWLLEAINKNLHNDDNIYMVIGEMLFQRHELTHNLPDLEMSILAMEQAEKEEDTGGRHNHPSRLGILGRGYFRRFTMTGRTSDVDKAVEWMHRAYEMMPWNHPERYSCLERLATFSRTLYHLTFQREHLPPALRWTQAVIEAQAGTAPQRLQALLKLVMLLRDSFSVTGDGQDLQTALQRYQEAFELMPQDYAAKAVHLDRLADLYQLAYLYGGPRVDTETRSRLYKEAFDTARDDDLCRPFWLQKVSRVMALEYEDTGKLASLNAAIEYSKEALRTTADDSPYRPHILRDLGAIHSSRYGRNGAVGDLETALHMFKDAVSSTPHLHIYLPGRLADLAGAYLRRYYRFGDESDLTAALERMKEALELPYGRSDERPSLMAALGNMQNEKYLRAGEPKYLDEAIQTLEEALDKTPKEYWHRSNHAFLLARAHYSRFGASQDLIDIEACIDMMQQGLSTLHPSRPSPADELTFLGVAYLHKWRVTELYSAWEKAASLFREASKQPSSTPSNRLDASLRLMRLYASDMKWSLAHEQAVASLSLVPLVAPRSLEHADKQHRLRVMEGVASDAAAIALMAGRPVHEGVQLLEMGRGVLVGSLGELRTDLSDLGDAYPALAEEFVAQRDLLDHPPSVDLQFDDPGLISSRARLRADRRFEAEQKLEAIIQAIRNLPGFEQFLLPLTEEQIKTAAKSAAVIIVNGSRHRCDALIIREGGFAAVPLPLLKMDDIRGYGSVLRSPAEVDTILLEWLWDTVAHPILEYMGIVGSKESWPRITWIMTGLLARFPIHAAGYHHEGTRSVLSRVISSYATSLRFLTRNPNPGSSRAADEALASKSLERVVLVGAGQLPFVPAEINQAANIWRECNVLRPDPNSADILEALRDCDLFHYAGHGHAHSRDPARSSLVLGGGEQITVSDLYDINLHRRRPFLAFLSACGTGRVNNLVDEGLSLMSVFQAAGFQHVIGTLWDADDESCLRVSELTHRWIRDHGLTTQSVSEALHRAVRELRSAWLSDTKPAPTRSTRHEAPVDGGVQRSPSSSREQRVRREVLQLLEEADEAMQRFYVKRTGQDKSRDIVGDCDSAPLNWVQYIHYTA